MNTYDPQPPSREPANRRRAPRYHCTGQAEVRCRHAGPPSRGKLLDLSLGGCYLEADFAFDIGRRVEVLLQVSGMPFRAIGQVVYTQVLRDPERPRTTFQYVGMGIRFVELSCGARTRLQTLIREFEEAIAPPASHDRSV